MQFSPREGARLYSDNMMMSNLVHQSSVCTKEMSRACQASSNIHTSARTCAVSHWLRASRRQMCLLDEYPVSSSIVPSSPTLHPSSSCDYYFHKTMSSHMANACCGCCTLDSVFGCVHGLFIPCRDAGLRPLCARTTTTRISVADLWATLAVTWPIRLV